MYGHCTDTSVNVHNNTSFPIIPEQSCDADEYLLRAGAAPSELPPSWHQSFQLTDHPGAACHAQIATATGSPHTHCCHACHPLLQSHRFPQESQTSYSGCTGEEWHQKNLHLLDRDCLHPYCPEKQRAEGCPSVLHLHLSVDHENLLRQLVIPCTYIVHTLYIYGSYIDILCTCAPIIQCWYH